MLPHSMNKPTPFEECKFISEENPDWGYCRTLRSVLMTPSAEWVQSVYSCQFDLNGKKFIVPNRDYPYEGLLASLDGENWKFLDCIALSLQSSDGQYLSFLEDSTYQSVHVDPWSVTYHYTALLWHDNSEVKLPFSVSYYMHSTGSPDLVTGFVDVNFDQSLFPDNTDIILTIKPFVDVRHMFASSDFHNYNISFTRDDQELIHIRNYNRLLTFHLPPGVVNMHHHPEILNWWYKLGTGSRLECFSQENQRTLTQFTSESKSVAAFFNLQISLPKQGYSTRLHFSCSLESNQSVVSRLDFESIDKQSTQKDRADLEQIERVFNLPSQLKYRDAILGRIVGLTKFKTNVRPPNFEQSIKVPHAGAWWFKTPWFRDVFEGLLSSFKTLMEIPEERQNIKAILSLTLSLQHEITGLIPNRIPEYKDTDLPYNSSDATLLCFIVATRYALEIKDQDFALAVLRGAHKTISGFSRSVEPSLDGSPRLHAKQGLLLSTPHHSWLDTRTQHVIYAGTQMNGLPNRVSEKFVEDLYDHVQSSEAVSNILSSPCFFLPEINSQWILMLRGVLETITWIDTSKPKLENTVSTELKSLKKLSSSILSLAEQHFLPLFWNDDKGFLFNAVYENEIIKDDIACESAVSSAAMLGNTLFSQAQLKDIWKCIKRELLVNRRLVKYGDQMLPFGIIAKKDGRRIFYNDAQYHSEVVWLRSTPYLVRLLQLIGEEKLIEAVLVNTLDHQMSEGAIFYNAELFSRPFGNNPHPIERTQANPVPVKNPIQFWSQWCDLMIECFGIKEI
jgi:glycogen debranching enzyme